MVIETRWWFVVTVCGVAACGAKISTDPGTGVTLSVVRRGNSTFVGVVTLRSTAEGRVYSASVEPGSSVSLDLPPGVDTVSVTGIPDYCWPDQDEISVTVTEGTPTQATFELTCIGDFAYSIVDQMAYLGTDGKLTQHTYPGAVDFLSWSPDGTSVLVTEWTTPKCSLSLFHVATGTVSPVGHPDFAYNRIGPAWSGAGDRLALARTRDCTGPAADDALMLYDGSGATALDSVVGLSPEGMAWRPGTDELAYADGAKIKLHSWANGTDAPFADVSGPVMAWSHDGSRLAVQVTGASGDQIVVLDDQGAEIFRLGGGGYSAYEPEWAYDASGLLFLGARPGEQLDIYYVSADGSDVRPVTTQEGTDAWPSWPADGDYFLYTSNRAGFVSVFLGNLLGLPHRHLVRISGSASARFRPGAILGLGSGPAYRQM